MKTLIAIALLFAAAVPAVNATTPGLDDPNATALYRAATLKNSADVQSNLGYTEIMRQMGLQGTVVLRLRVDANGRVADYRVADFTHPVLLARVLESLPNLRFEPALNQGEAAASWITMPFRFEMGN